MKCKYEDLGSLPAHRGPSEGSAEAHGVLNISGFFTRKCQLRGCGKEGETKVGAGESLRNLHREAGTQRG